MITVALDGSGDYTSIQEAVNAVTVLPETIFIKKGIYKERVEIFKPFLTLEGEDAKDTVITEGYYANMLMEDGSKRRTFRTYTLLINTDNVTVKNLTIENSAGLGKNVGQAIALYAEGDRLTFNHCRLLGCQDTLFTGPLPEKEVEPGGFTGPTQTKVRKNGRQLYEDCYIEGEVDFIFGSGTAYFENCEIHSLNRFEEINGYATAPSHPQGQTYGYVFNHCHFTSDCPDGTVYLGRPWRIYGQTVLIECELDGHIREEGFHDWNKADSHDACLFAEYNCSGAGYTPDKRASFVKQLTKDEAGFYTREKVLASL